MTDFILVPQWYWRYECSDFLKVEFDSYIIPQNEIDINNFRLLDVDNRAALPINTFIQIIITATDVLHSTFLLRHKNYFTHRRNLFSKYCEKLHFASDYDCHLDVELPGWLTLQYLLCCCDWCWCSQRSTCEPNLKTCLPYPCKKST